MNRLIDNQFGLRILKALATDFKDMPAYHLGIIDEHGNVIRKSYQLKSEAEKKAYTYLDRIVIILKKAIKRAEARGDFTLTKALSPALFLVREQLDSGSRATMNLEGKYQSLYNLNITFVEEEILVNKFLEEEGEGAIIPGGAPTNNTAGPVCVNEPKIYKKDIKKYKSSGAVVRRPQLNIPEVKP
jgi:hypothetical protein